MFCFPGVAKYIIIFYAITWFHCPEIDLVWDSVKMWTSIDEAVVYLDVIFFVVLYYWSWDWNLLLVLGVLGSFLWCLTLEGWYGGSINCVFSCNVVNIDREIDQFIDTNNIFKLLVRGPEYDLMYISGSVKSFIFLTHKLCFSHLRSIGTSG